jgi:hypothetical protein
MKKMVLCMLIIFAIGCGVPKNLRVLEDKESSIIGISVKTITLSIFRNKAEVVYFVRLDEKDDNNIGNKIIPTNYARGDYVYLINAKPGKYAAVASFFSQTEESYNTFFDAAAIQASIVEVGPNQVVYAGDLVIENQMKNLYQNIEQNGDKAQLHYYSLLKSFMYGTYYCGTPIKTGKTKEAQGEFLNKTRTYFKDSQWIPLIEKSIEGLEK